MGFFYVSLFYINLPVQGNTHPVTYLSGTKVEIEGVCRAELITGLGQIGHFITVRNHYKNLIQRSWIFCLKTLHGRYLLFLNVVS